MALIKSISGIRGTIGGKAGESLTPIDVTKFVAAFGHWAKAGQKNPLIVIGRDARPSGDMIATITKCTLASLGINVLDLGLSTTPTVGIAVAMEEASGGIIISASHNPSGWNALKLLNKNGEFISQEEANKVLAFAENGDIVFEASRRFGSITENDDYIRRHIGKILKLPYLDLEAIKKRKFKVIVDTINSSGAIAVPQLLDALCVQYTCLNSEPDGQFAHNPEPLPENITQICQELESGSYDLGIVVDPDVDRLALVREDGIPFGEEYSLVAVSDFILSQRKGHTVSNISSTRALRDITEKHGGTYHFAKVGEVNVVKKMKEVKAIIGGEGNGGIILPELHYGRDALVGIALFLTFLANSQKPASKIRSSYPDYFISKNKLELTADIDVNGILKALKEKYNKYPINDLDGVRIEFGRDWVQLRKSNTESIVRIYAESESKTTANHLAKKIIEDLKEFI